MIVTTYRGITVYVYDGEMGNDELTATVDMLIEQNPDKNFKTMSFSIDGDYLDVSYTYDSKPIDRIRRITGYLVGTLDRFNDAKRAEVNDRVKHL